MTRTIIDNAAISTMDDALTEHATGHVIVEDNRILAVGAGRAPADPTATRIDARGCLITPGFVNTHHHLYQWATRGYAQDATLFQWLVALYPIWGRLDAEITAAAGAAGMARLALTGCTTIADHHYVFPSDGGDQVSALVDAANRIGPRLHLVRGSMDRGVSQGGLPPDRIVEDTEAALIATEAAINTHHDPGSDARIQVAVGPCSPFSVTKELMTGAAELARRTNTRLHTHLAETIDEEEQCQREFGRTPVEYAADLGWLGADVWLGHGIHLNADAIRAIANTNTGVAHCPTSNARIGAGMAPVRELLDAGVAVGLGADGAASNESGGLAEEMHQALLLARLRGGPTSLSARHTLWMATVGGARCLGRSDDLGSLRPGALADLAVWRLDGFAHAGIADPVAALVFGSPAPLELLLVDGKTVVANNELRTADDVELADALRKASSRLAEAVA
ncbi:MAG TPA: 8-oxoguanine deaminase [Pseudonocardiaceae bacterium]|jgi:cytosine/adenosine deaminase-related metal-dependent hydrolase|nr:8-oxoguanine deaminase [Pseudonocardiaceae bacterium]